MCMEIDETTWTDAISGGNPEGLQAIIDAAEAGNLTIRKTDGKVVQPRRVWKCRPVRAGEQSGAKEISERAWTDAIGGKSDGPVGDQATIDEALAGNLVIRYDDGRRAIPYLDWKYTPVK